MCHMTLLSHLKAIQYLTLNPVDSFVGIRFSFVPSNPLLRCVFTCMQMSRTVRDVQFVMHQNAIYLHLNAKVRRILFEDPTYLHLYVFYEPWAISFVPLLRNSILASPSHDEWTLFAPSFVSHYASSAASSTYLPASCGTSGLQGCYEIKYNFMWTWTSIDSFLHCALSQEN
jgi:hypothetical protein